ncbi:DNA-N1-methyladenine dioxygenase [Marinobacter daqiaonensis]|uniref:DNA-N1-methyladenine dioxygenase n=1 Tax=Marinobacter daqiaonensis TaxID=650891 RepID=A0A1I6HF99_9GAMM|nr:DNA oxidative demethylase AlkB [Marinobacter daqiaonensis]SFR53172.1 DNA-N1-methyladenine dioxygenase [Marinobacter daqiaonensis]
MPDLFTQLSDSSDGDSPEVLGTDAYLFRGYALSMAGALLTGIGEVSARSPFRQMKTPGGRSMSAAMTGCGQYSWVTDARGYRYTDLDPDTGRPWPAMPVAFRDLATAVAAAAGFSGFVPDVCLINRYQSGARMGLHQDRDEQDFRWPIVSVSLGVPAVFLWGGLKRGGSPARLTLEHGDVLVWGGEDRLRYHGIAPVKEGRCDVTGHVRYNLTFRRAR